MRNLHWSKEDYFPYLIENTKSSVLALEYLGKFRKFRISKYQIIG